jgi:hypothetical protein
MSYMFFWFGLDKSSYTCIIRVSYAVSASETYDDSQSSQCLKKQTQCSHYEWTRSDDRLAVFIMYTDRFSLCHIASTALYSGEGGWKTKKDF